MDFVPLPIRYPQTHPTLQGYPFASDFGLVNTEGGACTQYKAMHPAVPDLEVMQSAFDPQTRGAVPPAPASISPQGADQPHVHSGVPEVTRRGVGINQVLVAGSHQRPD